MNIYDLISRAQKLRKETQLDSVSPDRVGGLHEDTLKYINEFQLLASSPSLHKIYASVSAMQSDKSPKSDLTGKPLKPGQLVVIVPANQTDATAGDVYRYDGPSGNTSAWTFVAKIGAVPADAELSATSTNPPQNKVVTEKLTELESETILSSFNRFNKATITNDMWQQASGTLIVLSGYFVSDYIPVNPGEKIFCTHGQSNACTYSQYDASKVKIEGASGYFTDAGVIIEDNAKYILVSAQGYTLNGLMVTEGFLPGEYWEFEPYSKAAIETFYKENNRFYTDTNLVLWLGTSIPEGATYPQMACSNNGYRCINKAKGSSRLGWYETPAASGDVTAGRSLTASVAELESFYRPFVSQGIISESTLESWKQGSYENSVLPYINGESESQVSMIVIDHGYNDYASINSLMADKDNINWESLDKDNFIGAFHFLINEIQKINPFIKIVISGYFQNSGYANGANICEIQQMIANQYRFQLMDAWNYSQIGQRGFIEGTSDYIENLNAKYGTSFNVPDWTKDSKGNIIALKMYCPDNIHPHSDPTGNTNKRLNAVYTKLLSNSI